MVSAKKNSSTAGEKTGHGTKAQDFLHYQARWCDVQGNHQYKAISLSFTIDYSILLVSWWRNDPQLHAKNSTCIGHSETSRQARRPYIEYFLYQLSATHF